MNISAHKGSIEDASADVVIIPLFEETAFGKALKTADGVLDGHITTVIDDEEYIAKRGSTLIVHSHGKILASRILIVGLGIKKELTNEVVRRAAATAAQECQRVKAKKVVVAIDDMPAKLETADIAQALTEGFYLGLYHFGKYKGKENAKKHINTVKEVQVLLSDISAARKAEKGVARGTAYAKATILARDLVNEPAIHMKPKTLAKLAEKIGKEPNITVKNYNEAAIRKLKMGSFLSVAEGSDEEPYLIHLRYTPQNKKKPKKLVLVGKGITFDSGGLSLKPAEFMDNMKCDMAGAAVILGIFQALVELQPHIEVHGVIAATENMPSGKATRPGDVVTAYNGKTIEVKNTDAEGRLVLADALAWSEKTIKPDMMIDLATLTGAAIVALGQEVAALLGTDQQLIDAVKKSADDMGEQTWQLPMVAEYDELIHSPIADLQNIANIPWAGTIIGALFLKHFVKDTPWLHIDIAGPSFAEKQVLPYAPYGATGYGVRTVLHYIDGLR